MYFPGLFLKDNVRSEYIPQVSPLSSAFCFEIITGSPVVGRNNTVKSCTFSPRFLLWCCTTTVGHCDILSDIVQIYQFHAHLFAHVYTSSSLLISLGCYNNKPPSLLTIVQNFLFFVMGIRLPNIKVFLGLGIFPSLQGRSLVCLSQMSLISWYSTPFCC